MGLRCTSLIDKKEGLKKIKTGAGSLGLFFIDLDNCLLKYVAGFLGWLIGLKLKMIPWLSGCGVIQTYIGAPEFSFFTYLLGFNIIRYGTVQSLGLFLLFNKNLFL